MEELHFYLNLLFILEEKWMFFYRHVYTSSSLKITENEVCDVVIVLHLAKCSFF